MIEFIVIANEKMNQGNLIYRKDENSFDFVPSKNADIVLLLGYVHIGIDSETMTVQQVWGYLPCENWKIQALTVPSAIGGKLLLKGELQPGMSYKIYPNDIWDTKFDPKTGWICIGENEPVMIDSIIEFASNSVAVIAGDKLKALWLKPEFE